MLNKAKEHIEKIVKAPMTQTVIIAGVIGIVGASIKHTISHSEKYQQKTVVSTPVAQTAPKENLNIAHYKKYQEDVAKLRAKYEHAKMISKEDVPHTPIWMWWDALQGTEFYRNAHITIEKSMIGNKKNSVYNLNTSTVNALLKKHGSILHVINGKTYSEKEQHQYINLCKQSEDVIKKSICEAKVPSSIKTSVIAERPAEVPFGVLVHRTDNDEPSLNLGTVGNIKAFGNGGMSVHFIIARDGQVIQMKDLSRVTASAALSNFTARNKDIPEEDLAPGNTFVQDRFLDMFLITIEMVSDVPSIPALNTKHNAYEKQNYTKKQQASLFELLRVFQKEYHFPTENIVGHGEMNNIEISSRLRHVITPKNVEKYKKLCAQPNILKTSKGLQNRLRPDFPYMPEILAKAHVTSCSNALFFKSPVSLEGYHADNGHEEMRHLRAEYNKYTSH